VAAAKVAPQVVPVLATEKSAPVIAGEMVIVALPRLLIVRYEVAVAHEKTLPYWIEVADRRTSLVAVPVTDTCGLAPPLVRWLRRSPAPCRCSGSRSDRLGQTLRRCNPSRCSGL
jgi:hypothetical protein